MTRSPVSFGSFGSTPDALTATDFYRWFHLEQTAMTRAEDGRTTAAYRSIGQFRELAVLSIESSADGWTDAMNLRVARSFVDDPREGVFARDLIASFIREAAAEQGYEDRVAALLLALRNPPLPRRCEVVYTNSNPIPFLPRLPGDFGPALAVCDGTEASFHTGLTTTFWRMSNDVIDGVGTLTLSFSTPTRSADDDRTAVKRYRRRVGQRRGLWRDRGVGDGQPE
jgi:hypothetical protein